MSKFLLKCVDEEANAIHASTFRSFCEMTRDHPIYGVNPDLCLILNAKLATKTGEPGTDMVDPTKAPGICVKFKNGIIILFIIRM